jgi:hypothetical protein
MTRMLSKILALVLAGAYACSGGSGGPKAGPSPRTTETCAIGSPGCPTLDPTVPTNLADASKFLYTGPDPIQRDVEPGAIDLVHVAVVRGQVFARSSSSDTGDVPLAGVKVTVPHHPELGWTTTQADGWFSMAVNGGGRVSVAYELAGYIPAQRAAKTRWLDYGLMADLVMTEAEPGTSVTLSSSSKDFQVVRGLKHGGSKAMTPTEDTDGARRATLLIPPGTTASVAGLNDTPTTFRATEFTTGSLGRKAMPADMAPTTAYTYAVDLSIDEANGASVSFNQPVVFYLENFASLPVGNGKTPTAMPMGFFDPNQSAWVPTDSGQVVRVLSNDGGTVTLDLDGSGVAAADGDFTPALYPGERAQIAALYTKGQELWRIAVPHFCPYDANFPPADAISPDGGSPGTNQPKDKSCESHHSIIECENQILAEQFPVAGTPFALRYQSERSNGYLATARIPLTGATSPAGVLAIQAYVEIAGRRFTYATASTAPNQTWTWTWDHKDAFGRIVTGNAVAHVGVGFTYKNVYDPTGQVFYGGDGTRESANGSLYNIIDTYAGGAPAPQPSIGDGGPATQATLVPAHIAMGPDGLYIADAGNGLVRKVDSAGIISTVAGSTDPSASTDPGAGKPAKSLAMAPYGIAVGPDSSVYVTSTGTSPNRVLKIDAATGLVTNLAGTGGTTQESCLPTDPCGDGLVATSVHLAQLGGVAMGPDGAVYFSEIFANGFGRVRQIALKGTLSTVISPLSWPDGLSFGPDGSLYVVDSTGESVYRLTPGGKLSTVAGGQRADDGDNGDGGPATKAGLFSPIAGHTTASVSLRATARASARRLSTR